MSVSWSTLTFTPDSAALATLSSDWCWLLPDDFSPLLFSVFGDVFYSDSTGKVAWLNTGTAEVIEVAACVDEFERLLGTAVANDWFLPDLVEALHRAGKVTALGECYTYAVLPIFAEGKFEEWNFAPVPGHQHFAVTAHVHRQMAGLPDGAQVKFLVEE